MAGDVFTYKGVRLRPNPDYLKKKSPSHLPIPKLGRN